MPETFSVVFCSRNNNVVDATNLNAVKYTVAWNSILPTKYKKFICQFVFKSENTATVLNSNGFVGMDFGRVNVFDGVQSVNNQFGVVYPANVGTQYFYSSTNNDNNDITVQYPTNNNVTLTLKKFDGSALPNMQHYCLIMNFVGIEE
jgi:hypothetical protein